MTTDWNPWSHTTTGDWTRASRPLEKCNTMIDDWLKRTREEKRVDPQCSIVEQPNSSFQEGLVRQKYAFTKNRPIFPCVSSAFYCDQFSLLPFDLLHHTAVHYMVPHQVIRQSSGRECALWRTRHLRHDDWSLVLLLFDMVDIFLGLICWSLFPNVDSEGSCTEIMG